MRGGLTKKIVEREPSSSKYKLDILDQGDHLCCIYEDKQSSLSAITSFVLGGLKQGEKCLYIVDDRTKKDIIQYFEDEDIDIDKYLEEGQFEFLTKKEAYLKDDYFDPDEMIDILKRAEEEALDEGYRGLRVTGEMTWVLTDLPGTEKLIEYEAKLNKFFPDSNSIGLCQYNEKRFSPEILIDVLHTHPRVLLQDQLFENPFYLPPDSFLAQLKEEVGEEHYEKLKDEIIYREELARKERLATSSLDAASVEVYWVTPKGKFVYTNEKVRDKLGYSKEELDDMYVWDIDPSYPEEKRKEFWEELKDQKIMTFESEHKTKEGETFPVEITTHHMELNGREYEFAFAKDITEEKEAREEREEQNRQLKRLFSNLPGMVYRCLNNENWTMRFVSDGCKELTGYDPDELIADKELAWNDLIRPEDWGSVSDEIRDSLEKEEAFEVTYRIETKDGEEKWVWEKGQGIFDEESEIIPIEGFIQDITERKKMEEELREEKKRFQSLAEYSSFSLFVYREKFLYVNPRFEGLTGYSKEELLEMNFWEVVAPDHKEMVKKRGLARIKAEGEEPPNNYELKIKRKDGEERWVLFTGVRITYQGKTAGLGTAIDITARKEIKEELKELTRFREKIINDVNIWLNVLDKDGNVVVWNKAAEEISGYSSEEVVGHDTIWKWLYPDEAYRQKIMDSVQEILAGEEVESYETKIKTKVGKEKVISWNSHPLVDDDEEIIGSIAIGLDITKQKEAEERKEFLNTLLRQDLKGKNQTIEGYLQLLEETDLEDEQRDFLEKAMRVSAEAEDILELAKDLEEIEETDWTVKKDINKVLDQAIDEIQDVIEAKNITIVKKYDENIPKVKGDYSLTLLFSRLLKTRIEINRCERIEIDVDEEEDDMILKIDDDGEKLPKGIKILFTGKLYTGFTTGAGGVMYYMIKQIAKGNDAEIRVEDSELGGASFSIELEKAET